MRTQFRSERKLGSTLRFSAAIEGDNLYGRGAIDCKGGIALSLYALRHLKEQGHDELAQVLVVSDEEAGADSQIGLMHVLKEGYLPQAAVYHVRGIKGRAKYLLHWSPRSHPNVGEVFRKNCSFWFSCLAKKDRWPKCY